MSFVCNQSIPLLFSRFLSVTASCFTEILNFQRAIKSKTINLITIQRNSSGRILEYFYFALTLFAGKKTMNFVFACLIL